MSEYSYYVIKPKDGLTPTYSTYFILGIEHDRVPILIEASLNGHIRLNNDYVSVKTPILEKRNTFNINVLYRLKKMKVGAGHFWYNNESFGHFIFPNSVKNFRGVNVLTRIKAGSHSEIELNSQIVYKEPFAALTFGTGLYSLSLIRNLNNHNNSTQKFLIDGLNLSFGLGSRFFVNNSKAPLLVGETSNKMGIMPSFSAEISYKNWPFSIALDQDYWIALNGGSFERDVKGFISNSGFGIKWNKAAKNDHQIRLGLNYTIGQDFDIEQKGLVKKYPLIGIGFSCSYEVAKGAELELKNIFPIRGRKLFESRLMTLGLFHRFKN